MPDLSDFKPKKKKKYDISRQHRKQWQKPKAPSLLDKVKTLYKKRGLIAKALKKSAEEAERKILMPAAKKIRKAEDVAVDMGVKAMEKLSSKKKKKKKVTKVEPPPLSEKDKPSIFVRQTLTKKKKRLKETIE